MYNYLTHIDQQLLLFINGHHCLIMDHLMVFASGKLTWLPLYLLLIYYIARRLKAATWLFLLFVAITIVLTDQISVHLFKEVFMRPRPCHEEALSGLVRTIAGCGGPFGFVSSHAANTTGLVVFLIVSLRRMPLWIYFALGVYWALVIYSRVYLGVHYPLDMAGGTLLGLIIGMSIAWLYHRFGRQR